MLITITMLPGVAMVYYGQEIGMMESKIRAAETRIPNSNYVHKWSNEGVAEDQSRLPMQWDNTMNAGWLFIQISHKVNSINFVELIFLKDSLQIRNHGYH